MGTGSFPGVKRPGRGVDHPPSSSADVEERVELYLYSPSGPPWPVLGWTLPYLYLFASQCGVSWSECHTCSTVNSARPPASKWLSVTELILLPRANAAVVLCVLCGGLWHSAWICNGELQNGEQWAFVPLSGTDAVHLVQARRCSPYTVLAQKERECCSRSWFQEMLTV